ncbi:hypothetical protein DF058_35415 [Burkholderia cenocepacia]|nr:hypothetical protein DF058_35415 [Burkholderia cenocepacia]RRA02083.1 hypothetical protein DF059_35400 [Burkholderia cenocepacia]
MECVLWLLGAHSEFPLDIERYRRIGGLRSFSFDQLEEFGPQCIGTDDSEFVQPSSSDRSVFVGKLL